MGASSRDFLKMRENMSEYFIDDSGKHYKHVDGKYLAIIGGAEIDPKELKPWVYKSAIGYKNKYPFSAENHMTQFRKWATWH